MKLTLAAVSLAASLAGGQAFVPSSFMATGAASKVSCCRCYSSDSCLCVSRIIWAHLADTGSFCVLDWQAIEGRQARSR